MHYDISDYFPDRNFTEMSGLKGKEIKKGNKPTFLLLLFLKNSIYKEAL